MKHFLVWLEDYSIIDTGYFSNFKTIHIRHNNENAVRKYLNRNDIDFPSPNYIVRCTELTKEEYFKAIEIISKLDKYYPTSMNNKEINYSLNIDEVLDKIIIKNKRER